MKLPLLPSERERLHKQRLRSTDEDICNDNTEEGADEATLAEGGGESLASPGAKSQGSEVSDAPAAEKYDTAESTEEETKRQERVRQYQEKSFSSQPPLPVSATSRVLQDVLLSTSQFVNAFVADADSRLEESATEISALERQMGLLEGKFASVAVSTSSPADRDSEQV